MHFLLDAGNSASTGNDIKPVKAQIRMKGERFKENVITVTRKGILRETARSEIGRVIRLALLAKAEKFKNLCDQFPEEALPVYTSREFGGSNWIIDSRATQHMTFEKDCLSEYVEFKQPCVVNLEDNRSILAYGKGNYCIKAVVDDHIQPFMCSRCIVFT